jgi:glycine cleavage system H protein
MKYSQTHEWVKIDGEIATIGISDYAQKELGEVVYVELPTIGHAVTTGDEVVVLESTKAAVDIYAPVSGEITAVNEELRSSPELINSFPESKGWLYKLKLRDPDELDFLMSASVYRAYIAQAEYQGS